MSNSLKIALCLLFPSYSNDHVIKISETQVILPSATNAPIYMFDYVFDLAGQSDCYFSEKILSDLIEGQDSNITIYDPLHNRNNLLDTKLILSLSPLFNNNQCTIHIEFSEVVSDATHNLLEQKTIHVTNITDMLRYYKLGASNRHSDSHSIFTVYIQQENKSSQLSITDISGSNPEQIIQLINDDTTTLLASISQIDDIETVSNSLDILSRLNKRAGPYPETEDYLHQTILRMTHEISSLRSHSRGSLQSISTISDKAHSTFSSISNFTHLTVPNEEEKELVDQVDDLQNQLSAARAQNAQTEHELNETISHIGCLDQLVSLQDEMITHLEENVQKDLESISYNFKQLTTDRDELQKLWDTVQKVSQGDTKVMEELKHVRFLLNSQEGVEAQRNKLQSQLQERQQAAEKTQHLLDLQTARCNSLDRRVNELQQELLENRDMFEKNDISGMIQKLEIDLSKMEIEKQRANEDCEKAYEYALNKIQSMERDIKGKQKFIDKFKQISPAIYQQLMQEDSEQKRSSGNSVYTPAGHQHKQGDLRNNLENEELEDFFCTDNEKRRTPPPGTALQKISQKHETPESDSGIKASPHPSSHIPPLGKPPTEPIPPLPKGGAESKKLSRDDSLNHLQVKIDQQEEDIKSLLQKQEELKEKLKKACESLEKEKSIASTEKKSREIMEDRLQEVMSKKNKFLCF